MLKNSIKNLACSVLVTIVLQRGVECKCVQRPHALHRVEGWCRSARVVTTRSLSEALAGP